jgi:uncharacterized iron-regulated membrane protein
MNRPGPASAAHRENHSTIKDRSMRESEWRKWHRKAGIILAPLLILQAVSGLFLSIDWLLGIHHRGGEIITELPPLLRLWDFILVEIHYGFGVPGALYHILLGIGLVWLAFSGFIIYLRVRSRLKR